MAIERLTHDENTKIKVRKSLYHVGLSEPQITAAINQMLNDGIVFREVTIDDRDCMCPLQESLEAAMDEFFRSQGEVMTGYIGMLAFLDKDGDEAYTPIRPDGQGDIVTAGMVEALKTHTSAGFVRNVMGDG